MQITFIIGTRFEFFKTWLERRINQNLQNLMPESEQADTRYDFYNIKCVDTRLVVPYTSASWIDGQYVVNQSWDADGWMPEAMVFDVTILSEARIKIHASCQQAFGELFLEELEALARDYQVAEISDYLRAIGGVDSTIQPDKVNQTEPNQLERIFPTKELIDGLPGRRAKEDGHHKPLFWQELFNLYELHKWEEVINHEKLAEFAGVAVGTLNNAKTKYYKNRNFS